MTYEEMVHNYLWFRSHLVTCPRDLRVDVMTWLGVPHPVEVCAECSHLYADGEPYPPAAPTTHDENGT